MKRKNLSMPGHKDLEEMDGSYSMRNKLSSRGFTLIAALLMLLLMSGLAIGLLMMVNTEQRAGGNDVENSLAFRGAEAGVESMTSSIAAQFSAMQAPSAAAIDALNVNQPVISGISFPGFNVVSHKRSDGSLDTSTGPITGGPNAGLYATLIKVDLDVTAQRPLGEQVRMLRSVEIALIPVFQFGVFSDSDLDFFAGPNFDFGGRIHTNGNLFLADIGTLTLHDKISVFKEVYRQKLANGYLSSTDYPGQVLIPTNSTGCATNQTSEDTAPPINCRNLKLAEASQTLQGSSFAANTSWPGSTGISQGASYFRSYIVNSATGAKKLSLPFVQGTATPIEIVHRPPMPYPTSDAAVGPSRLYNQAQIRIMLADTAAENHPDGSAIDADDVLLDNVGTYAAGVTVDGVAQNYFAHAKTNCTNQSTTGPCDTNFIPNFQTPAATDWPLINGYLRVEVRYADDTWHPVTREWLGLGFARGLLPPNSANAAVGNNAVHPKAILILQEQADRNADHLLTNGQIGSTGVYESLTINGSAATQYNWFPINLYDIREGEVRDTDLGVTGAAATCAVNGVVNLAELDVYNLKRWLAGTIGASGANVDKVKQNGYVLYFSDRRGMQQNPNATTVGAGANNVQTGEYGFEDTINAASAAGTPDDVSDGNGGEDVDGNKLKDNWGAANVGYGFGQNTAGAPRNPYVRVNCMNTARKNRVSGARHALRLVNGSYNGGVVNLPLNPLASPPSGGTSGGFTVASENPVYIVGDYNANGAWISSHAAASVIADSVTLLSNNWGIWDANNRSGDIRTFYFPTNSGSRPATETWYRLAIAAGKNIIFAQPTAWASSRDYGTDGGMHNFLRYLESWGGIQAHYQGSLVSLFYSQYNTGIFKCCTTVYGAPDRKYSFDTLFLDPANLPPGTPMFKDVNNLTYRQDFTPH